MSSTRFAPGSRYFDVETAEYHAADGRPLVYLRRRLVPDPSRFVTVEQYRVTEGDRLDRISAAALGDPLQFHRLADANGVLHPCELEVVGQSIRLTLPEGFTGPVDA